MRNCNETRQQKDGVARRIRVEGSPVQEELRILRVRHRNHVDRQVGKVLGDAFRSLRFNHSWSGASPTHPTTDHDRHVGNDVDELAADGSGNVHETLRFHVEVRAVCERRERSSLGGRVLLRNSAVELHVVRAEQIEVAAELDGRLRHAELADVEVDHLLRAQNGVLPLSLSVRIHLEDRDDRRLDHQSAVVAQRLQSAVPHTHAAREWNHHRARSQRQRTGEHDRRPLDRERGQHPRRHEDGSARRRLLVAIVDGEEGLLIGSHRVLPPSGSPASRSA